MSMYKQFKTDPQLEQEGIWYEPSETFRIKIARAGGENKKFIKTFEQLAKPYRRAMQMEQLSEKRAGMLMREAYAKAVILDWNTRADSDQPWSSGIESENGEILPVTEENIIATLENLPDLFTAIVEFSRNLGFYLEEVRGAEVGN